ncbi:MAG: hypothetical protein ACE5GX_04555 [Thermoanaerobaculia bacterium]
MSTSREDRGRKASTQLVLSAILIGVVLASALWAAPGVDFPFDRVFGTYENVEVDALPISNGALNVQLSSPENTVTLEAGSLRLEVAEDGLHKVSVDVTFSGEGQLVTEIAVGSLPARFQDVVRFPRQRREVSGWVTIEAVEEGYRVVTEEFPDTVEIEIESALAGDLVGFCRRMSLFTAGDAGCDNLDDALRRPKLPLPERGSDFLVRSSDLTESERERLDLYLAGATLQASVNR